MTTDLARHIQETPLVDTHEHLKREPEWLHAGPDILQDLFANYVSADLRTAGASPDAMRRLLDASDPTSPAVSGASRRRGWPRSSPDTARRCG